MAETWEIREGEVALERDPSEHADAGVVFIGRIRSPWNRREECPKNIGKARETGRGASIELAPAFAPALAGLKVGQAIVVMYWMDHARRDLLLQNPRHVDAPRGTFALRSPNRPNPIALSSVVITDLDQETGRFGIDAIDCLDGTPLVDLKPWLETVDIPPA